LAKAKTKQMDDKKLGDLITTLAELAPEESSVDDMLQIVVALDRGQGFAPLTGALQRMRLSLMASQVELERLIVWYAR
jgi:hypothetical protein